MAFGEIYKGKKVLLTGHTGFKGSWMAEWLLMLGAEVHGYALDPHPEAVFYEDLDLPERLHADHRADVRDLQKLTEVVNETQPDIIFHLAAQPLVRLSYDIPVETFDVNVMGSVNVLEAVRQSGIACSVVMITTDKCYENREWLHSYRESDAMGGHDPYSASKGAAEIAISSYRRSYFQGNTSEVKVASARAGNVIGGGDWAKDRIIPDCMRALNESKPIPVRNKIATRPWQHVLEPISGYLWLGACMLEPQLTPFSEKEAVESGFNFGPQLTSNKTVSDLVSEVILHYPGEWLDESDPNALHEASKLNLAIDKAFHILEWKPVWGFEKTIEKTVNWYRQSGSGDTLSYTRQQITSYMDDALSADITWSKKD